MNKNRIFKIFIVAIVLSLVFVMSACFEKEQKVVYFNADNMTQIVNVVYTEGEEMRLPEEPKKHGYKFEGWYLPDGITPFTLIFDAITNEMRVTAKWSVVQFTVNFEANSGTPISPVTQDYNTQINAVQASVRTGYTLRGWYTNRELTGSPVSFPYTVSDNITLYAAWDLNVYTITLNTNGGQPVPPLSISHGSSIESAPAATRAGHSFAGWYLDEALTTPLTYPYTVDKAFTIYANWQILSYTVTFDSRSGSEIDAVTQNYHTLIAAKPIPEREGYDFADWYIGEPGIGTRVTFPYTIESNVTLSAHWTIKKFKIEYFTAGETGLELLTSPPGQTINWNTDLSAPAEPVKYGFDFMGWTFEGGGDVEFPLNIKQAYKLVAKWAIKSFKVIYVTNGDTIEDRVEEYMTVITSLPDPVRYGYTFLSWRIGVSSETVVSVPFTLEADTTVYAAWRINQYTVKFDAQNGLYTPPDITRDYNTVVTLPETTKSGYDFGGWFEDVEMGTGGVVSVYNGVRVPTEYTVTHDVTLYAKWPLSAQCSVVEALDFESPIVQNELKKTVRNSVDTFVWDKDTSDGRYNDVLAISAGATLKRYAALSDGTIDLNTEITNTTTWQLVPGENRQYIIVFAADGEHSSRYTVNIYRNKKFDVTFVLSNSIDSDIVLSFEQGYTIVPPVAGTDFSKKLGFKFMAWYKESALTNVFDSDRDRMPANDWTLYARWEAEDYFINYNLNYTGATGAPEPSSVRYNQAISSVRTATRTGYTFDGWYTSSVGGTKISAGDTYLYTDSITLYACWIAKTFTVTFDYKPGNPYDVTGDSVTSISVTYDQAVGTLPSPSRTGYTFDGWVTIAGTKWTSATVFVQERDYQVNAVWVANTYTITYNHQSTHADNTVLSKDIKFDAAVGTLFTPKKFGYTFVGWFTQSTGGTQYTATTVYKVANDIDLYAHWTANTYNVTFNYQNNNAGTVTHTEQVVFDTQFGTAFPLSPGTKTGYTFGGWKRVQTAAGAAYTSASFLDENILNETELSNDGASITLFAYWVANAYIVTFVYKPDGSGAESADLTDIVGTMPVSITATYDAAVGTLPSLSRRGYNFMGWHDNYAGLSSGKYIDTTTYRVTSGITLYAIWEAKTFTVTYNYNSATSGNTTVSFTATFGVSVGTLAAPLKKGYTFGGWWNMAALDAGAGVINYVDGLIFDETNAVNLYAKWTANTYRLYYNYEGADFDTDTDSDLVLDSFGALDYDIVFDQALNALVVPIRAGFKFAGWYTMTEGGGLYIGKDAVYKEDSNLYIYAHWFSDCLEVVNNGTVQLKSSIVRSSITGTIYLPATYFGLRVSGMVEGFLEGCTNVTAVEFGLYCSFTTIIKSAFKGCTNLNNVFIPETVTTIGEAAFENCTSLGSMVLPDNTLTVRSYAFSGCTALASLNLNKATSVESFAFQNCISIRNLYIPVSCKTFGLSAFSGCSTLQTVTIDSDLTELISLLFANCVSLTTINIPATVTAIGNSVFSGCTVLTSIDIPAAVRSIGKNAFFGCIALQEVVLNPGTQLVSIGDEAFSGCVALEYFNNTVSGEYILPSALNTLGASAFQANKKLKTIALPLSITVVNASLFENCIILENVGFHNGITAIKDRAFSGCVKLADPSIPSSVREIGNSAFKNCAGITRMDLSGNNITVLGESVFDGCTELNNLKLPTTLIDIGERTFANCEKLQSVVLPAGLKTIGNSAFYGCRKLVSIELPNSVDTLGESAFFGCSALASVKLSQGMSLIKGWTFNGCTELSTITIPASIADIGDSAFKQCDKLTSVRFESTTAPDLNVSAIEANVVLIVPESVLSAYKNITPYSLYYVEPHTTEVATYNGYVCRIYTRGEFKEIGILRYVGTETELDIPDTIQHGSGVWLVKLIEKNAFKDNTSIMRVLIPYAVTEIQESAFEGCAGLVDVTFKKGGTYNDNQLNIIGQSAFKDCVALAQIRLPANLQHIRPYAFKSCSVLLTVVIENSNNTTRTTAGFESFTGIHDSGKIFVNSEGVANYKDDVCFDPAEVPHTHGEGYCGFSAYEDKINSSSTIGLESFVWVPVNYGDDFATVKIISYIGDAEHVIVPETLSGGQTVVEIANLAFGTKVKKVTLPKSVRFITGSAFGMASNLEEIAVDNASPYFANDPAGILYKKDWSEIIHVPMQQSGLVIIPTQTKAIYVNQFMGRKGITEIRFDKNSVLSSIHSSAFEGCTALETFSVYDSNNRVTVDYLTPGTYYNATLPESVTYIGSKAFYNTKWYDMQPNNSFVYLGTVVYTFKGTMPANTVLSLGNWVKGIADYAFENCINITQVVLSANITEIPSGAFMNCTGITNVSIGGNITYVGNYAFYGCSSLVQIVLPQTVKTIDTFAFAECRALQGITIPEETLTKIGERAFENCIALTQMVIPYKVKLGEMGIHILSGCTALAKLTVSGQYKLTYLFGGNMPPASLKEITIDEKIQDNIILDRAFLDCVYIEEFITTPGRVIGIGEYAFHNTAWYNLKPNGPVYFGKVLYRYKGTFTGTTLALNADTIGIGDRAFVLDSGTNCNAIITLSVPNTLQYIGVAPFAGLSNLTNFELPGRFAIFKYFGGASAVPGSLRNITITDGETEIAAAAFTDLSFIVTLTLPNSLKTISNSAFKNARSLTTITTIGPGGLTTIGDDAFSGCRMLTTMTVTTVTGLSLPDTLEIIGARAFNTCDKMEQFEFGSKLKGIGANAFEYCSNLNYIQTTRRFNDGDSSGISIAGDRAISTDVVIIVEDRDINDYKSLRGEFTYMPIGTYVGIHNATGYKYRYYVDLLGVATIIKVFNPSIAGNPVITNVEIPNTVINRAGGQSPVHYIFDSLFKGLSITKVKINDNLKEVAASAFENCTSLTQIDWNPSTSLLTKIGDKAFKSCESLGFVFIPDRVTEFGVSAFEKCVNLQVMRYDGASVVPVAGENWIKDVGKDVPFRIYVPDALWTGFVQADSVSGESTPEKARIISLDNIVNPAIGATNDDDFYFELNTSNNTAKIIQYVGTKNIFTVPSSITVNSVVYSVVSIGSYVGHNNITAVTLPSSVRTLEKYAFMNMEALASITIPAITAASGISKVGEKAFENTAWYNVLAAGPTYLTLTGGGKLLYNYKGTGTGTVNVDAAAVLIADKAFSGQNGLLVINLPQTLIYIGEYVFQECDNLTAITIPTANNYFDTTGSILYSKDRSKIIKVPAGNTRTFYTFDESRPVTHIAADAFANCTKLTYLNSTIVSQLSHIPSSVVSIGADAFRGCTGINGYNAPVGTNKALHIPISVTEVGENAFFGWVNNAVIHIEPAAVPSGWADDWFLTTKAGQSVLRTGVTLAEFGSNS